MGPKLAKVRAILDCKSSEQTEGRGTLGSLSWVFQSAQRRKVRVRTAQPVSFLSSASTLSLAAGSHILSVSSYSWQKPGPWQERSWGKLRTESSPSVEKGLDCVEMAGTAGLTTAAGS